jgi:hypothetical protein
VNLLSIFGVEVPALKMEVILFSEILVTIYKLCGVTTQKTTFQKWELGRPRRRWEDGIRMDLREIGLGGVDWIQLSQDRDRWRAVVSAVMNLRVLAPRS